MKKKLKDIPVIELTNNALANIITPLGIEFTKNTIMLGESEGKIYGITKYPQKVEMAWLSKICNIPNTLVTVSIQPVDNSTLVNALSRSVVQQRGIAEGAKDPLTRQRAEKAADDGERIIMQIDREGETVGLMSIAIMPHTKDDKILKRIFRQAEGVVASLKCKMRVLPNLQKESFQHIAPCYPSNKKIESILQRLVPMSTFVGGFPFASTGFNDGAGYYWGQDTSGSLVVVDPWKRGNDRTNTNFVIMGNSGTGKSTAIKHILISEYMNGTKIIVIDPESEYKDLCRNLKGDVISAVGGSKGMINPLQVRPSPKDTPSDNNNEGDEPLYTDEGDGLNDLALHIKNLEIFFNLYIPSISDMQRAVLKSCIVELYKEFGIDWQTDVSDFAPTDFPIFADLYKLVQLKSDETPERQIYGDLALLLTDLAMGSDSFLWNGHSTVSSDSSFICLDTHELQETSDHIKRTQYFNILTYCWEQMSKNRKERVLLVCDEAYLMIDTQVPQSLVYLRNVMKRARKYEGALAIISHAVTDFLSESIKQYGQALLDVPCYKILLGTDGPNLRETAKLYDLTEAEQELLLARKRGVALFMVGSKRFRLSVVVPPYKMKYMGSSGGR